MTELADTPQSIADALPLAFLVLLGVFRERGFGARHKAAIAASATANLALFWIFGLHYLYRVS